MIFKYQDTEYSFPGSLLEITLAKRIEFYEQHGRKLDELAGKISKIDNAFDREAESNIWHLDMAIRSFSFFTEIDEKEIRRYVDIPSLLTIYNDHIQPLLKQEQEVVLKNEYEFEGETWVLSSPELIASSKITFNEFLHSKEIVRQMNQVGKGKWDSLPYLCAIYLRKPGEPFTEYLVADNSDRIKLMLKLPMDIAIAVGFFLTGILNTYMINFQSSIDLLLRESTQQSTSTDGDG